MLDCSLRFISSATTAGTTTASAAATAAAQTTTTTTGIDALPAPPTSPTATASGPLSRPLTPIATVYFNCYCQS